MTSSNPNSKIPPVIVVNAVSYPISMSAHTCSPPEYFRYLSTFGFFVENLAHAFVPRTVIYHVFFSPGAIRWVFMVMGNIVPVMPSRVSQKRVALSNPLFVALLRAVAFNCALIVAFELEIRCHRHDENLPMRGCEFVTCALRLVEFTDERQGE